MKDYALRMIFNKPIQRFSYEYEYHVALDKFIWNFGCIAGWNIERIYADKILSYICATERPEAEWYLNKVLEEIKSYHRVNIVNNTERSEDGDLFGEILINFEEC